MQWYHGLQRDNITRVRDLMQEPWSELYMSNGSESGNSRDSSIPKCPLTRTSGASSTSVRPLAFDGPGFFV